VLNAAHEPVLLEIVFPGEIPQGTFSDARTGNP
jgi:hypothetical protein